jgi:hypothetical protein
MADAVRQKFPHQPTLASHGSSDVTRREQHKVDLTMDGR